MTNFTCYSCNEKITHNVFMAHDKSFCCKICRNKYFKIININESAHKKEGIKKINSMQHLENIHNNYYNNNITDYNNNIIYKNYNHFIANYNNDKSYNDNSSEDLSDQLHKTNIESELNFKHDIIFENEEIASQNNGKKKCKPKYNIVNYLKITLLSFDIFSKLIFALTYYSIL